MSRLTFDKATEYLTILGVEYHQDSDYGKQGTEKRHQFELNVFKSICLPFTPEEWCSLCRSGGDNYIGSCCGTTSSIQDIVSGWFRFESDWVKCRELAEVAELMAGHDGEDSDRPFSFAKMTLDDEVIVQVKQNWAMLSPWDKLAIFWHLVKDHYAPEVPQAFGDHVSELEGAISVLRDGLRHLSYERVFKWGQDDKGQKTSQGKVDRALLLMRFLPALKVVWEQVEALDLGPVEGFALIDLGKDKVASNNLGLCIFETQAEADQLLKLWREQEAQCEERTARGKPIDERIGVRHVLVSKERGLEFLDDGPVMDKGSV